MYSWHASLQGLSLQGFGPTEKYGGRTWMSN